ncbi:FAD-dependent monooxygenase [Staphylococcus aureus]|nr:FAD-dependent monooxygenase [Staphylococcus aureus]
MNNRDNHTSVLIVGGSLVGLSTSAFLSNQKVKNIVIERHPGSSLHPKAMGFTPRTMEIFDKIDIAKLIPQSPSNFRLRRARIESLDGKWFEETEWTPGDVDESKVSYSPFNGAAIAQDKLEPIIMNRARELGSDIRMNTELVSFSQDKYGVTATVRNRENNEEYEITADYLVAADGNRSPIREKLGIEREGVGDLRIMRSVLFKAPLDAYLESGVRQFDIDQEDLKAFLTCYGDGRWVLMFKDDIERTEKEMYKDIIKAIGRNDLDIEIITSGRWELAALIAKTFSVGRIFLAGDSAHTLPPTRGGFGANTGIQDAYNLAWKLAAVISKKATSDLLDTYDKERRPVANMRHDQTFARPDYKSYTQNNYDIAVIDDDAIEFGELYRSDAIIGADDSLPSALRLDQWKGQSGTRVPYLTFNNQNKESSTLDIVGDNWIILTADKVWKDIAQEMVGQFEATIDIFQVTNKNIGKQTFCDAFGISGEGAVVVRPDGVIAWRSENRPEDAKGILKSALDTLLFKDK